MKIGKLRFRPTRRGWTILALCALAVSSYTADSVAAINRIRSGVTAGSLELGGTNRDEARRVLNERAQLLLSQPVDLFADTNRLSVGPAEIGFSPSVEPTLEDAIGVGRRGNFIVRLWHRVRALFARTDVGWDSTHDADAANQLVSDFASQIDTEGHEAGIEARGAIIVPVGAVPGRRLDHDGSVQRIVEGLETWPRRSLELPISVKDRRTDIDDAREAAEIANRWASKPINLVAPDGSRRLISRERIAAMLDAVPRRRGLDWKLDVRFSPERVASSLGMEMKPFETEARSASFAVSGAAVSVVAGQAGRTFDTKTTARSLAEAADESDNRVARAAFSDLEPELTTEEARGLNIHELVSSFTTNHPCCAPRVSNIHKIADRVNGVIIQPGARFSLNGHVGERTTDKGYLLAPMIFDGEFRDAVGGGVSQFATTMFNAIFFGGYQLDTYKAHSYYISRYPAGREATVSYPHPDLAFTNNSKSGILVRTSYSSTSITVSFYGAKEGKVVTAESGERTNFKDFEEKRVANPALRPGEEKVVQPGEKGFDISVFRIINQNGNETRRRFFTRYKPEPRIIEHSPGPSPTPSGAPSPGPSPSPTAVPVPPGPGQ
ncbi:MAG: VanW family protein [Actinomycetota bacterium]